MKIRRRISTLVIAIVMAASAMSMTANAAYEKNYTLKYAIGAPSSVNVLSRRISLQSSGADRITIDSDVFDTYISGAYILANCTSYSTNSESINTNTIYELVYSGTTTPKKNVTVTVSMQLKDYTVSHSVEASGTIYA